MNIETKFYNFSLYLTVPTQHNGFTALKPLAIAMSLAIQYIIKYSLLCKT